MKYLLLLPFALFNALLNAQSKNDKLIGEYQDHFGSAIEIKADSTFRYSWHFDLEGSWSKGSWHINQDTLYLKNIPVYDTLRYKNNKGKMADSLVLSDDEKPEVISSYHLNELPSGGQNFQPYPEKLYYKNKKLFGINKKGKLIRKKVRGIWTKRKWRPWYFKSK